MITNFPSKPMRNRGGYLSFDFIPAYNILSFPVPVGNVVHSNGILLAAGSRWYKGYATAETLAHSDDPEDSPNGPYYKLKVTGFVPGDNPALNTLLTEMSNKQLFVVRLTDPRGKLKIIGSKDFSLEFRATFNSGEQRSSARGFTFQFTGNSLYRALECLS